MKSCENFRKSIGYFNTDAFPANPANKYENEILSLAKATCQEQEKNIRKEVESKLIVKPCELIQVN